MSGIADSRLASNLKLTAIQDLEQANKRPQETGGRKHKGKHKGKTHKGQEAEKAGLCLAHLATYSRL